MTRSRGGTTFYLAESPHEPSAAPGWFRNVKLPLRQVIGDRTVGFLSGDVVVQNSEQLSVVTIFLPRVRRGILWTVTEVHFLHPLSMLPPELRALRRRFGTWIKQFDVVHYAADRVPGPFAYYLEGFVQNQDKVQATPGAVAALQRGQYFVTRGATEFVLDKLCQALALRGTPCNPISNDG